jgi:hypothetical protein
MSEIYLWRQSQYKVDPKTAKKIKKKMLKSFSKIPKIQEKWEEEAKKSSKEAENLLKFL